MANTRVVLDTKTNGTVMVELDKDGTSYGVVTRTPRYPYRRNAFVNRGLATAWFSRVCGDYLLT
jgi:hypothetical protein